VGQQGDLAACQHTLMAPCIVVRGQSHLGARFAMKVNIRLDPPLGLAALSAAEGLAAISGAEPS
jgi:hypothetical protein